MASYPLLCKAQTLYGLTWPLGTLTAWLCDDFLAMLIPSPYYGPYELCFGGSHTVILWFCCFTCLEYPLVSPANKFLLRLQGPTLPCQLCWEAFSSSPWLPPRAVSDSVLYAPNLMSYTIISIKLHFLNRRDISFPYCVLTCILSEVTRRSKTNWFAE